MHKQSNNVSELPIIMTLVKVAILLIICGVAIFMDVKERKQKVESKEVSRVIVYERPEVIPEDVMPPVKPKRKHITLEPVEPGYIPDTQHYYIPWANRLKISLDEFKLLCQTVQCEAGTQNLDCKTHVAKVIVNRLYSEKFPDTMHDVIYQRDADGDPQFSVIDWKGFPNCYEIDDETEIACFTAITEGDIPEDVLYFNSIDFFTWAPRYKQVDQMFFSRG